MASRQGPPNTTPAEKVSSLPILLWGLLWPPLEPLTPALSVWSSPPPSFPCPAPASVPPPLRHLS